MRFAVGLDISLRSPGCAIFDALTKKWYVFAFAQLVREIGFTFTTDTTRVELFPRIPRNDMSAYMHIEAYIIDALCTIIPAEFRKEQTTVCFEGYAFATREMSGHNFKLHEVGGILKHALHVSGFTNVHIVVVQQWKRTVIGHGHASKLDVIRYLEKNGPCLNFLDILGYDAEALQCDEKGQKVVPKPSQDWADACALATYAQHSHSGESLCDQEVSVKKQKRSKSVNKKRVVCKPHKHHRTSTKAPKTKRSLSDSSSFWGTPSNYCKKVVIDISDSDDVI